MLTREPLTEQVCAGLFRIDKQSFSGSARQGDRDMNLTAVLYALIAAALFGISTPIAKVLIGSVHPAVLAGLLYCGAGFGVALLRKLPLGVFSSRVGSEAALGRSDLPWL